MSGRFVNRHGATISAVSFDTRAGYAKVVYSPDVPDGAGGFGGFLTIWALAGRPGLFARIVTLPGGLVGPAVTIRATHPPGYTFHAGVAYSPVDHVFLVAVGEYTGLLATQIIRLNQNAQPLDDVQLSSNSHCLISSSLSCNEVNVVWNPISNEFGGFTGMAGIGRSRECPAPARFWAARRCPFCVRGARSR